MADTQVLGTCVFGRAGSSPASRTSIFYGYDTFYAHPNQGQSIEFLCSHLAKDCLGYGRAHNQFGSSSRSQAEIKRSE